MLLADWEVGRVVKNCGRVFAGRGQHFQTQGHSFPLYGPILSRSIKFLSFFLAVNLLTSEFGLCNFLTESAYALSTAVRKISKE